MRGEGHGKWCCLYKPAVSQVLDYISLEGSFVSNSKRAISKTIFLQKQSGAVNVKTVDFVAEDQSVSASVQCTSRLTAASLLVAPVAPDFNPLRQSMH